MNAEISTDESPAGYRQDLAGLTALVTGGASGIGLAVVRALHASGATVFALDRASDAEATRGLPGGVTPVVADVTDDVAVRAAVAEVEERRGGLDIVVNSAGIGAQGRLEDNGDEEWQRVLDVNVMGVVRVVRAALPLLEASPSAAVVNIGSVVAAVGIPERALYSASKGAVTSLTRAMAADLAPRGVRVNLVAPGYTRTPWVDRRLATAADPDRELAQLISLHPIGRLVSPEEVAAAVLHLAGPAASATTGAVLAVDGGMAAVR